MSESFFREFETLHLRRTLSDPESLSKQELLCEREWEHLRLHDPLSHHHHHHRAGLFGATL